MAACLGHDRIAGRQFQGHHFFVTIEPQHWLTVAQFIAGDPAIELSVLRCLTGVDYPERGQLAVVYDVASAHHKHEFCIKVFVRRDRPSIPSVAAVWRAADWHEREAYDLFGINFTGHPDMVRDGNGEHPRRILLPEDWVGFPLRKDYQFPREFNGISRLVSIERKS